MTAITELIDLSIPVSEATPVAPGVPAPRIGALWDRETLAGWSGVSWEMPQVTLAGATGTHLAAPLAYHADGADVPGVELDRLFEAPVVLVDAVGAPPDPAALDRLGPLKDRAVLIRFGHDAHRGDPARYFGTRHGLSAEAAEFLAAAGPALVGTDAYSLEAVEQGPGADPGPSAASLLTAAGIPLVLSMRGLDAVPAGALLQVLPAPVAGLGAIPVRPLAIVRS